MIDALTVLKARSAGEMRYSVVTDYSGDLNCVLAKFGLAPCADQLLEFDREAALSILTHLLWKDMAYREPEMSEADAGDMAERIVRGYECATSRFFSNGDWSRDGGSSWMPLTESTFDGGLIIAGAQHFFCIWFQDED